MKINLDRVQKVALIVSTLFVFVALGFEFFLSSTDEHSLTLVTIVGISSMGLFFLTSVVGFVNSFFIFTQKDYSIIKKIIWAILSLFPCIALLYVFVIGMSMMQNGR